MKPALPSPVLKTVQVYDPPMCCSTGVCGLEVDLKLVQFTADLDWLKPQGVIVQRHSLSQNPAAFVENELVRAKLTETGETALPIILVNGMVAATGAYPGRGELAGWLGVKSTEAVAAATSSCGCSGSC